MANSTLLGGERVQQRPAGTGTGALGPSDSSDSGSDVQTGPGVNEDLLGSDTDAAGTGERSAAGRPADSGQPVDLGPDHVVEPSQPAFEEGLDRKARDARDLSESRDIADLSESEDPTDEEGSEDEASRSAARNAAARP